MAGRQPLNPEEGKMTNTGEQSMVAFMDTLPKTSMGKVLRKELRHQDKMNEYIEPDMRNHANK